jgi:hypothetical protein
MRFARWVFLAAGLYGVVALAPMLFLEGRLAPGNAYPAFYYGFIGLALAWQLLFLALARDPVRFRPMMPFCVLEKASFAVAVPVLYLQGRTTGTMVAAAAMDALFGILFVAAFLATKPEAEA